MKKKLMCLMLLSMLALSATACSKKKAEETTAAQTETTAESTAAAEESTEAETEAAASWEAKVYGDASEYYELKVSDVKEGFGESDSLHFTDGEDSYSYSVLDEATTHAAEAYLDQQSLELDELTQSVYTENGMNITYEIGKSGDTYKFYGIMDIGTAQDVNSYLILEYSSAHVINIDDMAALFSKDYISAEKLGK